jgi:hypothetical protein
MSIARLAHILAAAMTLSSLGAGPAMARMWKATPEAIARDYAVILDSRPSGELVYLIWFVPQIVPPNSPGAEGSAALLRRYIVVAAIHGHLEKPTLKFSFEDVPRLEAADQSGQVLTPIAKSDLPPATVGMLAAVETAVRQSMGAMGNGIEGICL